MIHLEKFETNITSTCTNRCICCDHYSPLQEAWFVDPEKLEADLRAASRLLHAGDYRLIGGEPTLHPQILEILDIARASRVADTVSVWTNGMRLEKMAQAFWKKVDGIAVTVYPKLGNERLDWIKERCEEACVSLRIVQHPHFNRTFSQGEMSQAEALEMYARCIYRSCNEYDNGWFYHCNNARFISSLVMGMEEGTDGINLHTASEEEFRAYLEDKTHPFESCKRCVQTKLIPVEWREVGRSDWYEESEYRG